MNELIEKISKIGIVPVVALHHTEDAKTLAQALCDGGIHCVEITFRTEAAEKAIKIITKNFPDMLVGAGTVLTIDQVDRAVAAGAKFIVSPGLNPKVVRYCQEKDILMLPGCSNPSDVEQAIELGLEAVKFFPAEAAGGINMMKAMSAPYSTVKFMPTGGINISNLIKYLDFNKVIACGGSWMVKTELIEKQKFDEISCLCKEAVRQMLGFEVCHIGVNMENEEAACEISKQWEKVLGLEAKNGKSSIFVGDAIEIMKSPHLGRYGHIAVATNYIERAVYYMREKGYRFRDDSAKYDENGNLKAIYIEDEIAGFAVHLVQK